MSLLRGVIEGAKELRSSIRATGSGFKAGMSNRLNADWAISIMSPDQKIRISLRVMRERSRQLAANNDYAARFLNKAKENVIGSSGIAMEMALDPQLIPNALKLNEQIEAAWERWCELRRGVGPTVDGRMSFVDASQLWIASKLQDGENFVRKVRGFAYNPSRFGVQFFDPDQIDVNWNQFRRIDTNGQMQNEIRMGVELDEWRRPIAYWAFDGHPAETPSSVRRIRIPADQMDHSYVFKSINQTRGVPWMHTAMLRMNMLGGYEEAELVAARLGACKMAALQSKTGDEYKGTVSSPVQKNAKVEVDVEPASLWQLPEGMEVKPIDWNHPNVAFPEFASAMLRGVASGLNVSYTTLTGDLRAVNFSSIRQGMLDEREGWKLLQTFAVEHWCKPVFSDWLLMAVTSGQLELPASLPLELVEAAAQWTPRGWDWVDPKKDVDADVASVRSGMNTLQAVAAKRGQNWVEVLEQRAKEIEMAKQLGVPLDFTSSGAGGVEGDTANESDPSSGGQGQ
jgi:lambda family phage portal protein